VGLFPNETHGLVFIVVLNIAVTHQLLPYSQALSQSNPSETQGAQPVSSALSDETTLGRMIAGDAAVILFYGVLTVSFGETSTLSTDNGTVSFFGLNHHAAINGYSAAAQATDSAMENRPSPALP